MKRIILTVTPRVYKTLNEFKYRTGNSVLAIIRIAIDEYIQRNTRVNVREIDSDIK